MKSAELIETYIKKVVLYKVEYQKLLSISRLLLNDVFEVYLPGAHGNIEAVWKSIEAYCKNHSDNNILIYLWRNLILETTRSLSDNLSTISTEDWDAINDPNINPFENLTMKKEYTLQVLFDAFMSIEDETISAKYEKVRTTEVYTTIFDFWLKLLKLLQFDPEFSVEKILQTYVQSKYKNNYSNS